MKSFKSHPTKTVLTITVGFLVVYFLTEVKWSLVVALVIGSIGVLSTYLSAKIEYLWMKLAWLLGLIIPNIVLSILFYFFLFPIALLSKLFQRKDLLRLKKTGDTNFIEVDKSFAKSTFERMY